MDLITVIVPVYNVEKYLAQCINSIINQTYSDLEIILVDDGSTDKCSQICDSFAKSDSRIKAFHTENRGLSAARNLGIENAHGRYLSFIDSDDCISSDFIEKLYNAITKEKNSLAICNINTKPVFDEKCEKESRLLTLSEAKSWLDNIESKDYGVMVVAMNKLYERSLFENIRYPEGKLHEDAFVIFFILEAASSISYVSEPLYKYTIRPDSITGNSNKYDVRHLDVMEAFEGNLIHEIEVGDLKEAEILWKRYLTRCIHYQIIFKDVNEEVCSFLRENYKRVYYKYRKVAAFKRRVKYRVLMLRL